MTSKSEIKCLYFWVKISVFIEINPIFCNLTGKVLNIYSYYLSCFKFDAVFQLTYILSSILIKSVKIFSFFFCLKIRHFDIQVYFRKYITVLL